jgi:hypothetical protein
MANDTAKWDWSQVAPGRRPRRLTDLIVREASLVDVPANKHARVVLWKRDNDLDRGYSRPPHKAGDEGNSSGRLEEEPDPADFSVGEDDSGDLFVLEDSGKWFLVNEDGNKVGGPFADKAAALAALAAPVGKVGAKISAARLKKLKDLHRTVGEIINEQEPTYTGQAPPSDDAESTLDQMAEARQRQINKSAGLGQAITKAQAYDMILRENPGLYEQYRRERWAKGT